jgi:hypothetical protein
MWIWDMLPLIVRKVLVAIFGIMALIGLPIAGYLSGESIVTTNVEGRSSWRSAQDARAGQWNWPTYLLIGGLVGGFIIFIFCMIYVLSANKESGRSIW